MNRGGTKTNGKKTYSKFLFRGVDANSKTIKRRRSHHGVDLELHKKWMLKR